LKPLAGRDRLSPNEAIAKPQLSSPSGIKMAGRGHKLPANFPILVETFSCRFSRR
jgi:hypothetical protein